VPKARPHEVSFVLPADDQRVGRLVYETLSAPVAWTTRRSATSGTASRSI
jgi:hypothetical protein